MHTGEVNSNYSGFIVIRTTQNADPAGKPTGSLQTFATSKKLSGIQRVLEKYNIKKTRPVIRAMPPDQLLELERRVSKAAAPPQRSLSSYWKVDIRHAEKKSKEIVKAFNALDEVDIAYAELEATDPAVNPADDPHNAAQNYQDPAPVGIDARFAWTQQNGEGAGVGFVDLEQGWFLNHEDYANKAPTLLFGDNRDGVGTYVGNHGTAVLGEVAADDNTVGVVGISPSVSAVNVTSHWDTAANSSGNVADAIVGALPTLQPGDILLLEIQKGFLPTETDIADFDAIRLAVALGIIVVEAAGNGSADLDSYMDAGGNFVLNRGSADFMDSGAIMVGASVSTVPHNRIGFSNFGSRIDCYAWGENVTTAGYGDLDDGGGDNNRTYTSAFNGTSSASPIVSGAAVILQGLYKANTPGRLTPDEMRTLLSDPATGTPQGPDVAGFIGVMPDLRAIIENTLPLPRLVTMIADSGDFGNVCRGCFKDMTLVLNNCGNARLRVSDIISSSAEFIVPDVLSYPLSIEAGTSLEVPIRLQPAGFGQKSSTIEIVSDNPNGSRKVKVSGRTEPPRLVTLTADKGQFGDVCVGSFRDQDIILSNSGRCPLTVTGIESSSPEFIVASVQSFPVTIHPGDALDVPIRFEPTSAGAKSGTIKIASDDPKGPVKVHMRGRAPTGQLVVTGSTCIGGVKACCVGERTISICNVGDCKLRVSSVAFKRSSKYWQLVNNPFPATLHPGACLSVLIRYKAMEKCPKASELVIRSDDPDTPVKVLDVMAYTIWNDHGCKDGCDDCCDPCEASSCSAQSMDACCWDEECEESNC